MRHRNVFLATLLLSILVVVGSLSVPALADSAPLSASAERALNPKDSFKECEQCPEMVVVPAGSFTMSSPQSEPKRTFRRPAASSYDRAPIRGRALGGDV
jgi:formylglycine-generating enzyme required for sulfatase activity